ncbi:MAG: NADH:ubiquinone oxidoreductase [Chloroflexaceae bacterium]|nr:NADH:ubiquinone oxidoreductase [Chloroflexaceae bacterium]
MATQPGNQTISVYALNTGSCGGCDREIAVAVRKDDRLEWARSPHTADVLLLTGPVTSPCKAPFLQLLREVGDRPLLVIGRCAMDGSPFGKGGFSEWGEVVVQHQLDGCPTTPEAIAAAIHAQAAPAVPAIADGTRDA